MKHLLFVVLALLPSLAARAQQTDDGKKVEKPKPKSLEETFEVLKKSLVEGDGEEMWKLLSKKYLRILSKSFVKFLEFADSTNGAAETAKYLGVTEEQLRKLEPLEGAHLMFVVTCKEAKKSEKRVKEFSGMKAGSIEEKEDRGVIRLDPPMSDTKELTFVREEGEWKLLPPEGIDEEEAEEDPKDEPKK